MSTVLMDFDLDSFIKTDPIAISVGFEIVFRLDPLSNNWGGVGGPIRPEVIVPLFYSTKPNKTAQPIGKMKRKTAWPRIFLGNLIKTFNRINSWYLACLPDPQLLV